MSEDKRYKKWYIINTVCSALLICVVFVGIFTRILLEFTDRNYFILIYAIIFLLLAVPSLGLLIMSYFKMKKYKNVDNEQ